MADLDDFFAKKDRKKSKHVKKFLTADDLAKKLEDTTKKCEVKTKKERQPLGGHENEEPGVPIRDEDEWKDFEEEKKDYSGLKIGHLSVAEAEQAQNASENDGTDNNSDGEGGEGSERKPSGPWKKVPGEGAPHIAAPEIEKPAPVVKQSASGAYVAPPLKNASQGQQQTPRQTSRLKNRAAPDIHNEEFFPTLSGAKVEAAGPWGRSRKEASFEEVKHGSRPVRSDQAGSAPLSLGNRYNTLADTS